MSRRNGRRGAAQRALRRIQQDESLNDLFIDETRGMSQAQSDRVALRLASEAFARQPSLAEVEREARQRRIEQRRLQAQNNLVQEDVVMIGADDDGAGDLPVVDVQSSVQPLIDWMTVRRNAILLEGQQFILRAGDAYYVVNSTTYDDLLRRLMDNVEFVDDESSDTQLLLELIRTLDFAFEPFVPRATGNYNMNPDRNTGSFLPFVHTIDDPVIRQKLSQFGLWDKIDPQNYEVNCLIHSMKGLVSEEVILDVMMSVRNNTVPRKHLRRIGLSYNLCFEIHTDGDKNSRSFGSDKGTKIELCLFKNHYFPWVKDTGVSGFAIKNWRELQKLYPDKWYLKKSMNGTTGKGVSSMRLMKILADPANDLVRPIDLTDHEIWNTVYLGKVKQNFSSLEFPEAAVRLVHPARGVAEDKKNHHRQIANIKKNRRIILERDGGQDTVKRLDKQIETLKLGYQEQDDLFRSNMIPDATVFFDFESCSQGKHEAYFVAWQVDGEEEINNARGSSCAMEFLDWINFFFQPMGGEPMEVTLIAHNVSYDISFLLEYLEPGSMSAIKKGNRFIACTGMYKSVKLHFKDSYKLIPAPLRDFPKMFNLSAEKEIMPYEVFTHDFIQTDFLIDPEVIKNQYSSDFFNAMKDNITKWNCDVDGKWDLMKYSQIYCERDVELLGDGWNKFREMSLSFFDLDINAKEIMTVAGMAFRHLQDKCFDETYSVSGIVLEFIRRATTGGQTQVSRNEPVVVEDKIMDQDKVSLYPAAMVSMPGIPKGKPKIFYGTIPDPVDYYYVQIEIIKCIGPDYDFPILSVRNRETGTNEWTNDVQGSTVVVGKRTLEDLIYWNDEFEYKVIQGYYWDEGWNPNLSTTIQEMYDRRAELKSQGNPAQLIYKLLMNSSYGRTGLKPIDEQEQYIEMDKVNRFITNNHDRISKMNIMPNGDTRIMTSKAINRHFNQQHVAAMILEWAKHLMRKVLLLQQRVGSPLAQKIYYTDTDSIHISEDAWRDLENIYKEKYNEVIEGKKLGQFHSDFELGGTFQVKDSKLVPTYISKEDLMGGAIYSKKLFVCGKKAYLDVLTSDKNKEIEIYHFRLKGIPENSVVDKCNSEYQGQIIKLYEDLTSGKRINFTLKGMFKTGLNGLIRTIQQDREVGFTPAKQVVAAAS